MLKKLVELGPGSGSPRDLGDETWAVNKGLQQLVRYGFVERAGRGMYKIIDPMAIHYLVRP